MDFHFLSQTDFKAIQSSVIEACKKYAQSLTRTAGEDAEEERTIMERLVKDFQTGDWNALSQQETDYLQSHAKEKWAGYLLYRWKFKHYQTMKKIPKFPLYLLVEPSSICNYRCAICFQSDKTFSACEKFMGQMDFDVFTRVIDEATAGGTGALTLASRGEPTLHPLFGKMLEYCAGKFYEVKINTNASRLNEKMIHHILKANIELVVFSVDAYDKETYKKVRRSDAFEKIVNNIREFHQIRKAHYPNSIVTTRAHGVKVHDDFDEAKFHAFWGDKTDEVTISGCIERWDTYNNPKTNNTAPCRTGLDRMYVWYDGTCNPCDADYKSYLAMGNVKDRTIADIWNGEKYAKFRQAHFSGKRSTLVPCDRCEI